MDGSTHTLEMAINEYSALIRVFVLCETVSQFRIRLLTFVTACRLLKLPSTVLFHVLHALSPWQSLHFKIDGEDHRCRLEHLSRWEHSRNSASSHTGSDTYRLMCFIKTGAVHLFACLHIVCRQQKWLRELFQSPFPPLLFNVRQTGL